MSATVITLPKWLPAWRKFREGFAEAIDTRFYTIEWLYEQVRAGGLLFWHTDDAAILCEIREYPTKVRVMHGLYATGALADVTDALIPIAEEYGRQHGCRWSKIDSRRAWARILRERGYRPYKTTILKDLADG